MMEERVEDDYGDFMIANETEVIVSLNLQNNMLNM